MLLQISPSLENVVIDLLRVAPEGLSALQVRQQVAKRWRAYSRRGIYKELQRLEREGVLMRAQGTYTLRLAWLLSLQAQVEQMVTAASRPEQQQTFLPARGHDLVVHSSDLVRWDRVWTQLMLILHSAFPETPLFQWVPRYWFNFTHPDIQSTFMPAAEALRDRRFSIIGGRTPLDFDCRASISRTSATYSFRRSPFENMRTQYINVIGDYLIVCSLDRRTTDRIDRIFEATKDPKQLPQDIGKRLLATKCRGIVRCSWAPQRAERYRAQFLKFFRATLKPDGSLHTAPRGEV
jgi:hypothetical protein